MSTLKFADTHNMVVFLSRPTKSKGFEQIIDFLNVNPIKYALTVNLTIYTSCIEQFWDSVNGEVQLQALMDRKKVIITESTIRRDLQLEDAEGVDFLPNAKTFEQLTLIGAKTTAWNNISSTMASAIICLAINQRFNFSKYIFESMVKNLDNVNKFLMYPRFVQVFLDKQVDGMSKHNAIYVIPSHTKKVFGNMKRVGKGFSGRETPLFSTMMVQAQEDMGEADEAFNEENVSQNSNDPLLNGEDSIQLNELMEICTNLQNRVFNLENTKTTQAQEIDRLKRRAKTLERRQKSRTYGLKRLYKVGLSARVESSNEEQSLDKEDKSKQGRKIDDINVFVAQQEVNVVEKEVDAAQVQVSAAIITEVDITLAQALAELKSAKPKAITIITTTTDVTTTTPASTRPKAKGIILQEPSETTPTPIVSSQQPSQVKVQDKGKGIMVEEPLKMKKKDQISFDQQEAQKYKLNLMKRRDLEGRKMKPTLLMCGCRRTSTREVLQLPRHCT
ncbi:hypothetical protein Tco_0874746 [Tanacetum coccineum]|uniref:Xylulose kinase-1 n=1 Tax=Tanacetum coccineum TaxID=301880 RepID=A0ABQ5BMJ5_9ASTR